MKDREYWDQASPEESFAEVHRLIEEAKTKGARELLIDHPNLQKLPDELFAFEDLEQLGVWHSAVETLDGVARLRLKSFALRGTLVEDLSPLSTLVSLEEVSLTSVDLTSIAPLARLSSLRRLFISDDELLSDIAPIGELLDLEFLSFRYCPNVTSIDALFGLTKLKLLDLDATGVSDISAVSNMRTLNSLLLAATGVSDLTPITGLRNLETLDLANTSVSSLDPLKDHAALTTLNLKGTKVEDLSALVGFTAMIDRWEQRQEWINWDPLDDDPDNDKGLSFSETPLAEFEPFKTLAAAPSAVRTIETLNALRRKAGLEEHYPKDYQPRRVVLP